MADPLGVLCARGEQGTLPSRVSYRVAHAPRCLEALIAGAAVALIITLHDNTITMAATSWVVCRCSLRPVNQQRHRTLTLRCRRLFSASDSIATPERYFARSHSPVASRLGGWELQVSPATTSSAPNQTAYAACTPALVRRLCPVQSPDEIYSRESWTRHDV